MTISGGIGGGQLKPGRITGLVFLLGLTAAAYVGINGYEAQEAAAHSAAARQLQAVADLKTRQLTEWLGDLHLEAQAINDQPWLGAQVQRWLAAPSDATARNEIAAWMEAFRRRERFRRVLLLDSQQNVRLAVPPNEPWLGERARRCAQESLISRKPVVSDLHLSTVLTNYVNMDWLAPVLDPADREAPAIATFMMEVDPNDFLYPLLSQWPVPTKSAETLLVRREGSGILYLSPSRFQPKMPLTVRAGLSDTLRPAVISGLENKQGFTEGIDYRGVYVFADVRHVGQMPWVLVTKIDHTEVCGSLRKGAVRDGTVGLLAALAIGLSLLLAWRRRERRYLRQELAAAERLAHIVKTANDIILLLDKNWNIVEANDRAVEKYGYTHTELLQMKVRDLRTPDAQLEFEQQMRTIDSTGTLVQSQHRRKDGSTFFVESSIRAIRIGERDFFQTIIRDITERKRADEALHAAVRLLEESQEVARLGSYVMDVASGVWTASRTLDQIFGIEDPAFVRDVQGWLTLIHPDDRSAMRDYFMESVLGRRETFDREYRIVRLCDHEERWVHGMGRLTLDEQGRVVRMVGTIHDITERKRADEALARSHSLLMATLESTADGILVVDSAGTITGFNHRFLTLWRIPESLMAERNDDKLIRHVLGQLRSPDEFLKRIEFLHREPTTQSMDELYFKDGRVFERYSQPQRLGETIVGRVWSFRDVTERKQGEAALRQKIETLERFQAVTVGRELQMIELKKEINALLKQTGHPEKYRVPGPSPQPPP